MSKNVFVKLVAFVSLFITLFCSDSYGKLKSCDENRCRMARSCSAGPHRKNFVSYNDRIHTTASPNPQYITPTPWYTTVLITRHFPTIGGGDEVVKGKDNDIRIDPSYLPVGMQTAVTFFQPIVGPQAILMFSSSATRCLQTVQAFEFGAKMFGHSVSLFRFESLKDVDSGLTGLPRKDPAVLEQLQIFEKDPLAFGGGKGRTVACDMLSSLRNASSMSHILCDSISEHYAVVCSHQIPIEIFKYTVSKKLVKGVDIKQFNEHSYVARINVPLFSKSLDSFLGSRTQ